MVSIPWWGAGSYRADAPVSWSVLPQRHRWSLALSRSEQLWNEWEWPLRMTLILGRAAYLLRIGTQVVVASR